MQGDEVGGEEELADLNKRRRLEGGEGLFLRLALQGRASERVASAPPGADSSPWGSLDPAWTMLRSKGTSPEPRKAIESSLKHLSERQGGQRGEQPPHC